MLPVSVFLVAASSSELLSRVEHLAVVGNVLYVAAHPDNALDHDLLRRAMAYGTALASFNVEAFGVERVARLTKEEITDRVTELQRITRFDERPIALGG